MTGSELTPTAAVTGVTGVTTDDRPLTDRVLAALDRVGHAVVLVAGRRAVTGARLAADIRAAAQTLTRAGVGPGTPVGFAGLPGPDTLVALLALRSVGACAVLLEPSAAPGVNGCESK